MMQQPRQDNMSKMGLFFCCTCRKMEESPCLLVKKFSKCYNKNAMLILQKVLKWFIS